MDHTIVMVKSEKGKSICHQVAVWQDESYLPSQLESIVNNIPEQYWLLHENEESAGNPGHSRNPGSIHDPNWIRLQIFQMFFTWEYLFWVHMEKHILSTEFIIFFSFIAYMEYAMNQWKRKIQC